jgi:predicted membrane channel-forming protein YqfA (hemolysin III family)
MAELRLPEIQWTFRRGYTYVLTAVLALGVAGIVWKLDDPVALRWLGLALCALIALLAVLYLAGATVTDLARLAAAARTATPPTPPPPAEEVMP